MIRAVLTDIEGTTSSLSFVKDVLFPYARARLPEFIRERAADPEVRALLDAARREAGADLNDARLTAQLIRWIDEDRKVTPLKALQGMIWETGYRAGELTGHIYDDALEALRNWRDRGLQLYVFSSGSIKAQQLLFGHTDKGDLTPLFDGYFDTTMGAKKDSQAYRRIAAAIGLPPQAIVFLSDMVQELDAARDAGMQTYALVRNGGTAAEVDHSIAHSFEEVRL